MVSIGVSLQVDFLLYEIGSSSFFNSFFSTVQYCLDPKKKKYPLILNDLYMGRLSWGKANHTMKEWDIENPDEQPPWGDNISSARITSGISACGSPAGL